MQLERSGEGSGGGEVRGGELCREADGRGLCGAIWELVVSGGSNMYTCQGKIKLEVNSSVILATLQVLSSHAAGGCYVEEYKSRAFRHGRKFYWAGLC